ncbi:hypothetical protein, partial [Paraburkholderia hospita]|uniref:hypothetical protein n=1 Tax=Paraburkholderia hospita TaxID=169430 RepID=UPI001A9996E0
MDEFILAIVVGVRFARKLGVLSKSFMRKRFWFFCLRRWVGFLLLRGHPGFAFCVLAVPVGVSAFALASAICSCVGIRDLSSYFMRCPCAGRHLLFFAA